ncbi:MarR family winged helix-turn-helix transcriptional regulator [Streptomyces sp. I05A-00742]|uniref:MarR family winged helix-turn-helix transcriptional regulator n=1 Tax=Streptomyces sp. I05A-00742 TaxID=2732853 RepID=UPI0014878425|nr:MarR family transcriptional regulator [Streptomyces sp. I05A-00742]
MGFQLLLGEFNARLAEAGYADVRPIHGMTFQLLRGRGATASELAEWLGVTKQAAGQLVDHLEAAGYVRRERHPAGGRRKLVVLTEAAHTHLAVAGRVMHGLEAELVDRPGGPDMPVLRDELARLVDLLGGDTPPPLRPVW